MGIDVNLTSLQFMQVAMAIFTDYDFSIEEMYRSAKIKVNPMYTYPVLQLILERSG